MASKHFVHTPKSIQDLKPPPLTSGLRQGRTSAKTTLPLHVAVRHPQEIPESVIQFFKIDPKSLQPYSEEERIFFAQVFMHEIDEGLRLLSKANRMSDVKAIKDFSNKMHFSHRLDHLRKLLSETTFLNLKPDRVHKSHKARNNQWGAIKTRLGTHPALAVTETGVGYKECNEDAYLIMPTQKVVALADGMGGNVAGNIASCIAVDFFEFGISQGMDIEKAISYSNDAIMIRSKSDPNLGGMHPMGCTFAAIQVKHSLLKIAHVGDTKVLVVRDGMILFQTQDHTQGQQLLNEGLVDNATAFELNHILNRCLGLDYMQPQRDVAVEHVEMEPGDRVLLLTDGITDNFFDQKFQLDKIAQLACEGTLSQSADLLIDSSHNLMVSQILPCGRPAKPDNISLAMMEYRG